MSRMRVVARENGITSTHIEKCRKRMENKIEGHSKCRSSPKTNEGVRGHSSRETSEANEADPRGRTSTEGTRRNDREDG